ncbi:GFA family protein [Onishia taeanensis]
MSNGPFYQGECGCGAVTLMVTGAPLGAARCECADCRGADGSARGLLFWPEVSVQVADGLDELKGRRGSHGGDQLRCRRCAEWVLTVHEQAGIIELPAGMLPESLPEALAGVNEAPSDDGALLARLGHRRG